MVIVALTLIAVYPSQLRDRFISTITVNLLNTGKRYEGRNVNQQLENKLNIPTLAYKMASRSANFPAFSATAAGVPADIAPGEPVDGTQLGVYRSNKVKYRVAKSRKGLSKKSLFGYRVFINRNCYR